MDQTIFPHLTPLPQNFIEYFLAYISQITSAIKAGKHHDHRRALLIEFIRKVFQIDVDEIELEHKIKAASARGRIDAFYRFVILEVKTDMENERKDAIQELKKYFSAQSNPSDYVAVVTDGMSFEIYDFQKHEPVPLRSFQLKSEDPHGAYRELDEILTTAQKLPPLSQDIVSRFGLKSLAFNRSSILLTEALESISKLDTVATKIREWNALLARVYGSSLARVS